ncbi:MAG: sulfotransferase, partial [Pseudomonadota bacterium]
YHGLYFPRRFREAFMAGVFFDGASAADQARWRDAVTLFLGKVSIDQGGRRLVVKNPTYTARLKMLLDIWPDAQFIHIRRNPYIVFYSMRNFHQKLCAALGLQTQPPEDVDAVVFETYARMMDALEADAADLPADRFIDLRYETLVDAPLDTLARIYAQLNLPGFDAARSHFETALSDVKDYQRNAYAFDPAVLDRVRAHWGAHIDRGAYAPPA